VLRHGDEDAWWQCHVENAVGLLAALLELLELLCELDEGLILVVLPRDICAEAAEGGKLLLHVLGGGLDVRLDPLEVFLVTVQFSIIYSCLQERIYRPRGPSLFAHTQRF
jgi:hypothetical protein